MIDPIPECIEPSAYEIDDIATRVSDPPMVLHTRVVTETGGGPDKTILNSPRFLRQHGYQSACAYMHPPEDVGFKAVRSRATAANATLLSVPDKGRFDFSLVGRLLKICREQKVAIWHAHDYKSNAIGLLLRTFHRMKLVTTVHGWVKHTNRTPLYYWIDRKCLPRYDHVICVSNDLQEECLRAGVREDRVSLISNAIDEEDFRRACPSDAAKTNLDLPTDRIIVGAVGRLSKEKGFDRLIRATKLLSREGLPIHTLIIGDGDERTKLEDLIKTLDASNHVDLLGFRSDVKQLFEAMDVFALTSLREGLPNVVLEAMAMEVPVLATSVAGIPELLTDRKNGLVVPIDDEAKLLDGLRELVAQKSLRQELALSGRKTIEERFSFRRRMERISEIYDSLLERKRA